MPLLIQYPETPTDAFERAVEKSARPTALGSRELREAWSAELRARAIFSARVTNAHFLQKVREVVAAIVNGDFNRAEGRVILMRTLDALGYTPEGGFPDSDVPVPPAVEGTLQDLRSFRRLDLILRTETEKLYGFGQKQRGLEVMDGWPAWELVRVIEREVPRDWETRFEQAGGTILPGGRLVAHKLDPVWDALGDSALFDDALDVDHPPFAFNSGMRWNAVEKAEWESLGGTTPADTAAADPPPVPATLPPVKASARGLDDDILEVMKATGMIEQDGSMLTMDDFVKQAVRENVQRENERRAGQ